MIQGTMSHDLNQLQLFKPMENDKNIDFKIIETVKEEDLKGMHILYLPEEYPEDSAAYYAPYIAEGKSYNAIFGHGTWDFVAQPGVLENSMRTTHSAPVFMWKDWKHTVENGFISFGHIHGRNTYGKKIFYSGSFTRWNYGERSEKGFTKFEYNLDDKTYAVEYVNNTMAPKFDVIAVSELGLDLSSCKVTDIQTALDARINSFDNLRIDLSGLSKENIDILKKYYETKENVKVEVRETPKVFLKESKSAAEFEKWHYITKRQLPLDKTIQKYCKEEMKKDISLKDIDSIISNGEVNSGQG